MTAPLDVATASRDELIAEIERLRAESAWRPIATAPRDGRDILLAMWGPPSDREFVTLVASYDEEDSDYPWLTLDGPSYHRNAARFWRPLPAPPVSP